MSRLFPSKITVYIGDAVLYVMPNFVGINFVPLCWHASFRWRPVSRMFFIIVLYFRTSRSYSVLFLIYGCHHTTPVPSRLGVSTLIHDRLNAATGADADTAALPQHGPCCHGIVIFFFLFLNFMIAQRIQGMYWHRCRPSRNDHQQQKYRPMLVVFSDTIVTTATLLYIQAQLKSNDRSVMMREREREREGSWKIS